MKLIFDERYRQLSVGSNEEKRTLITRDTPLAFAWADMRELVA